MFSNSISLRLVCVFLLAVLFQSSSIAVDQQAVKGKNFVINLASSLKAFNSNHVPKVKLKKSFRFYTVKFKAKNQTWNRLRLGFFKNKAHAETALKDVRKIYPDAFVGIVSDAEVKNSKKTEVSRGIYSAEYLLVTAADMLIDAASTIKIWAKGEKNKAASDNQTYFIISLKTAPNLSQFDSISKHPQVAKHALYLSELVVDDRTWYQYRIGFFTKRQQADQVLASLTKQYPLARLIRISADEKRVATTKIRAFTSVVKQPGKKITKSAPVTDPDKVYDGLVKKGTAALSAKNYRSAIQAFSELLSYPENRFSMDAQELLGFAYELNGEVAKARQAYERYISLYPESSGTIRVSQRLASLITARKATPKELRDAKKETIKPKWETYGSISQFYRRDTSSIDINTETDVTTINTTDKRVNLSLIDTVLNINSRRRSNDYDIRTRLTAGHNYDLLDKEASSKAPVSELYVDVLDIKREINGRFGRQSSSKGGVLGRFDGLDMGYQMSDWLKINLTAGYQVSSVYHSADSDNYFNGVRADFGTFLNAWDFSLYYIKQHEGDIIGREAVGSEFRYFHPNRSLFGLIDHDILFDITNTVLLNGSWTFANQTSLNATVDIRQSPILTAKNALQGQTFTDVNEMLSSFTEAQILQIAEDRTAETRTFVIGVSHPFSDDYTLNVDLTATHFSTTTASAGVEAIPGTGTDYFFNAQLVGTSVFKANDTNITGLTFSETSTAETLSLLWNYRIPITRNFRFNPRVSIAQRDNSNDTEQSIYGLTLKMDYRWGRNTSLEFEFGGETSDKTLVTGDEKNQVYFLNLGYQHSF